MRNGLYHFELSKGRNFEDFSKNCDSNGWTFNSGVWIGGKRFRAGDALVFNYNPSIHNVVAVTAAAYKSCSTPRGSSLFKSGKDRVTLKRGTNYFVCSVVGHCQAGMKMVVAAA